jgi:hypothetical protein
MTRTYAVPCPDCGHAWTWTALVVVAGVRSQAWECGQAFCGWSAVAPVNGDRPHDEKRTA